MFWLIVPVIFISQELFVPFLIFTVVLGCSAIMVTAFYKCPSCNKRALVQSGVEVKQLETDRSKLQIWLLPMNFCMSFFIAANVGIK